MLDKTFIRFIIVGIINTIIGYSMIMVFFHLLGLSYTRAYFLSYIIGIIISYFLTRHFVFFSQKHEKNVFIKFLISFAISYVLSNLVLSQIVENNLMNTDLAFILCMIIYSVCFYLLNKYIVFKH